jgi:hypothetical protein
LGAVLVAAVLMAGCGGGGSPGPDRAGLKAALARWGIATRAFSGELRNCGVHLVPQRNFFSRCMKQPPLGYMGAAAGLRRSFETSCESASRQAGRVLMRDLALMRREIADDDGVVNAALERRPHRGLAATMQLEESAGRTIARDLAQLRRLASGC